MKTTNNNNRLSSNGLSPASRTSKIRRIAPALIVTMKRSITCMAIACSAFLPVFSQPALAQIIGGTGWTAKAAWGPAITPSSGSSGAPAFVAWNSSNTIMYSVGFGAVWSEQASTGLTSTLGPAAATASAANTVYVAARGTASTDNIYYVSWDGSSFSSVNEVCEGTLCPTTISSPALATVPAGTPTTVLFAAWTTSSSSNNIEYGYCKTPCSTGAWIIVGTLNLPSSMRPHTTSKPALAWYGSYLFLAWVQDGQVYYTHNTSTLGGNTWEEIRVVLPAPGAQTTVAPALGVSTVPSVPDKGLFVAWTASTGTGYTVDFARWAGSEEWAASAYTLSPPGPVAILSPALAGLLYSYLPGTDPPAVCPRDPNSFNVIYTMEGSDEGEIGFSTLSSYCRSRGAGPVETSGGRAQ